MRQLTEEQAFALLQKAVSEAGGQKAFAERHSISTQFVNDVMQKRKALSKVILDAIGLERRTSYVRKARIDA